MRIESKQYNREMRRLGGVAWLLVVFSLGIMGVGNAAHAQPEEAGIPRFSMEATDLHLDRATQSGAFFDVLGRRSGVFGYENETFEVWTYPMKVLKDFRLTFEIEGYPLPYDGRDLMTHIDVRPEATVLTYTHAAFTARQIIFAPIDEPGVIMLLDIDTARPLTVSGVFRHDLRLMWPAGMPTATIGWDDAQDVYTVQDPSQQYVAKIAAPGARDVSIMPYQEEPRDVPTRFVLDVSPEQSADRLYPIAIAGSMEGPEAAQRTIDRLLSDVPALYQQNVEYYRDLRARTIDVTTPNEDLNTALDWATIGIDKGMVTNPMLGTGLIAGYRTSGASERPGFAWFFGRDALWTALAITSYGDLASTRTALDFLKQYQREDGRIPHEISQSAPLVDWFEEYPYPWNSADATPLYIIVHADHYAATGDRAYLEENWPSIKQAYQFTADTDTDGDHLIENVNVGHGWVEGGELYPAQEEIYMQGIWVEAARDVAALAEVMGESDLADEARRAAERTRQATEDVYWWDEGSTYDFATRGDLGTNTMYREDTVLPAVPLWWNVLDSTRAQSAIDQIGSGAMATNWGTRILSKRSAHYDALSYHNGSVWGLFTGWASMGAYRYTRPHVGYQALMANALLTEQDALGYVTELLSGDYNTAFGRSSHHQIWSEAMVTTPAVRGLLGLQGADAGRTLRFEPQLPAHWDSLTVQRFRVGGQQFDLAFRREDEQIRVTITRQASEAEGPAVERIVFAPALPRDATIRGAQVNGASAELSTHAAGDRQRVVVTTTDVQATTEIVLQVEPGSDVYVIPEPPAEGAANHGLRVLRSTAEEEVLEVVVEGQGGQSYTLHARSPHRIGATEGVSVINRAGDTTQLDVRFDGPADQYVRRTLRLPLQ